MSFLLRFILFYSFLVWKNPQECKNEIENPGIASLVDNVHCTDNTQ